MSDLKPCLCGSDKVHFGYEPFCGLTFWRVMCDTCGTQTSTFDTKEEAAKVWNTRPAEDAKDKEIERLKAEVTRYRRALHNLKEDCQRRLHWKNSSWERLFLHEVITHIDAELDYAPDSTKGVEK